MKKCLKCGLNKDLSEFYKDKTKRDGYNLWCKQCLKIWRPNHRTLYNINPLLKEQKCISCENIKTIDNFGKSKYFQNGYVTQCKQCLNTRYNINITLLGRFRKWKQSAKSRHIIFELKYEDIEQMPLICYYTGKTLTTEGNSYFTVSLDRINSSKGYTKDNVVFCCAFINIMKCDLSYEQFIAACRLVVKCHDNNIVDRFDRSGFKNVV